MSETIDEVLKEAFVLSYEEFRRCMALGEAGNKLKDVIEENKKLCERYPFLIPRSWTGEPIKDYAYEWTYLDDIPEGWKKAFGVQMCEELRNILIEADYLDKYQLAQVKEKFGCLRWYDNGYPESIDDKYNAWLTKYEALSRETCICCGKPGKMRHDGWISPWCDECYREK